MGSVELLVIGGGITGAAVAYDAASRGLSVALVEAQDFGCATSAATGKMIHGGLRYLKSLEFGLVAESLKERRALSDIAGPYVYPLPMLMPQAGLLERVGLLAYDSIARLSGRAADPDKRLPWHRWISGPEAQERTIPGVHKALEYFDCLMPDPERLTLAFMRSAVAQGAVVANYARVTELMMSGSRVIGVKVKDQLSNVESEVHAQVVVNAAGPWAFDIVHASCESSLPKPTVRSEGIYLLTRQLTKDVTVFTGSFGHFSFAPWRGHSMIGPTETAYRGAVSDWRLTRESIENFLALINDVARPQEPLTLSDVKYAWGGLRPLTEATESTYESSRSAEIFDHKSDGIAGLVTAAGGKYTTSRAFAEQVVDAAARSLSRTLTKSRTAREALDGCDVGRTEAFVSDFVDRYPALGQRTATWLARHYGSHAHEVARISLDDERLATVLDDDGQILAQVVYAVRHESAQTALDVVMRRTGLGTLGPLSADAAALIVEVMAQELGWDEFTTHSELAAIESATALPTR